MEGTNKVCNKCKKGLPIDVFMSGIKDECYKQCERCRLRGRAENARARMKKKTAMDTIMISDSEETDMNIDSPCTENENENLLTRVLLSMLGLLRP
jgi:hypothetical protein